MLIFVLITERECICEREREKDRGGRNMTIERECICEREREKDRGEICTMERECIL